MGHRWLTLNVILDAGTPGRLLSLFSGTTCYSQNQFTLCAWKINQVRQQDAYLAIRSAYPRGCCPRAAKGDKTYLQPVFLHR